MPKNITLRFSATCADCGGSLAVGEVARWYGRGRVFCMGEHRGSHSLFDDPIALAEHKATSAEYLYDGFSSSSVVYFAGEPD